MMTLNFRRIDKAMKRPKVRDRLDDVHYGLVGASKQQKHPRDEQQPGKYLFHVGPSWMVTHSQVKGWREDVDDDSAANCTHYPPQHVYLEINNSIDVNER